MHVACASRSCRPMKNPERAARISQATSSLSARKRILLFTAEISLFFNKLRYVPRYMYILRIRECTAVKPSPMASANKGKKKKKNAIDLDISSSVKGTRRPRRARIMKPLTKNWSQISRTYTLVSTDLTCRWLPQQSPIPRCTLRREKERGWRWTAFINCAPG